MVVSIVAFAGVMTWDSPFLDPNSDEMHYITYSEMILLAIFIIENLI